VVGYDIFDVDIGGFDHELVVLILTEILLKQFEDLASALILVEHAHTLEEKFKCFEID
jgi:hypothetical protein